jgi:hypothetical protein
MKGKLTEPRVISDYRGEPVCILPIGFYFTDDRWQAIWQRFDEKGESLRIIHAGFSCGDSRHIANACEVLGNLVKDSRICNLCDALLRASGEDPGHWNPHFSSIAEVQQWCADHGNNWLSECGKQALQPAGKLNA